MDEFEADKLRNAELAKGEAYIRMAERALAARDARGYAFLCNTRGMEIVDMPLYEQGCVDLLLESSGHSGLERFIKGLKGNGKGLLG